MRSGLELLRTEARARVFFAALTQSALGTGAAYVALLLVAYDRVATPWAISAVLIADLVAPMFLGPVFGAAADRWSRRTCMVVADVVRAVSFTAIAFVDSFTATVALALFAGVGTALFTPASLAALPSLVAPRRLPAATSLYGAISDFGLAAGPAVAALVLLLGGPQAILLINGVTFAISAAVLLAIRFGEAPQRGEDEETASHAVSALLREAREGLSVVRRTAGLRTILFGSALALFFAGLVNVAELPFLTDDLDADDVVYSVAVGLAGLGIVAGSLQGGGGGALNLLKGRYLFGVLVMGGGYVLTGFAPNYWIVFATFTVAGFGNGMMLVYERLIIQATVDDSMAGRVFGSKDALTAWAFAISFLVAGAAVSAFGPQAVLIAAGAGVIAIGTAIAVSLRKPDALGLDRPAQMDAAGDSAAPDTSALGDPAQLEPARSSAPSTS
jgi:MFS family permease